MRLYSLLWMLLLGIVPCSMVAQVQTISQKFNRIDFQEDGFNKSVILYNGIHLFIDNNETGGDVELDADNDLLFQTANATRMTILRNGNTHFNGNVGIGTANPDGELHLQDGDLIMGNGGERFSMALRSDGKLALQANSTIGDNSFVIDDDGLRGVGIGTDSPTEKLHVAGNLKLQGDFFLGSLENISDGGAAQIATNATFRPTLDGLRDLGTASFQWNEVYLTNQPVVSSDKGLKSNVQELPYGLTQVLEMRPVSYELKRQPEAGKHLGLIAQEVLSVIPEVVSTHHWEHDEAGGASRRVANKTLGVRYSALVPVLIAAIQEQQGQLQEKEERIMRLEADTRELAAVKAELRQIREALGLPQPGSSSDSEPLHLNDTDGFSLGQNVPNPSRGNTTISYRLPRNVQQAFLRIHDPAGRLIRLIPLDDRGAGEVQLSLRPLAQGQYSYSLLADGHLIATRQMLIVR